MSHILLAEMIWLIIRYDPRRSLYDQFAGQNPGLNVLVSPYLTYKLEADQVDEGHGILHRHLPSNIRLSYLHSKPYCGVVRSTHAAVWLYR